MLDIRRLRVLHAVSVHGSVTAAAAALGPPAPAVPQQLAALEREVGMRLTERAGRGIELTPAAGILVAHTDALLAGLDAAESDLAALRDQVSGRVALAAFPSAAATFVPAAWAALARTAPHVQLDLTEMEPEESLPAVLRGETDIAVAHEYDLPPPPPRPPLRTPRPPPRSRPHSPPRPPPPSPPCRLPPSRPCRPPPSRPCRPPPS